VTASNVRRVRSVFLSDLHLGYKGADILAACAFLRGHEFERFYLVGDILDGWKLESRWYWNRAYSDFLDLLMELRRKGVRIVVLTGNHDEKLRDVIPRIFRPVLLRRFGLRLEEEVVHRAADGRRYLVLHGDQFDRFLARNASKHADRLWAWLTGRIFARPPQEAADEPSKERRWSLGKAIAGNANAAWSLVGRYGDSALARAERDGMDGVICGHSHVPVLKERDGIVMADCGSWTGARHPGDTHSAVIETHDGRLELVRWPAMRPPPEDPRMRCLAPIEAAGRHPATLSLVRMVHALWHAQASSGAARSGGKVAATAA